MIYNYSIAEAFRKLAVPSSILGRGTIIFVSSLGVFIPVNVAWHNGHIAQIYLQYRNILAYM